MDKKKLEWVADSLANHEGSDDELVGYLVKEGKLDKADAQKMVKAWYKPSLSRGLTPTKKIVEFIEGQLSKKGAAIDNRKVAAELVKIAKELVASPLDELKAAVSGAKSFMSVGAELKKAKIKYDFSTSPMPIYIIKMGGSKWAIVNKKYADDADAVVGDIAIGKMS